MGGRSRLGLVLGRGVFSWGYEVLFWFPNSDDKEMTIDGSDDDGRADRFEFSLNYHSKVYFEHYPDFEEDAMVSDLFSLKQAVFGSLSLMKWKESEKI